MPNNEKKKKKKKDYHDIHISIESTPTSGSTSTDADMIESIFGEGTDLVDLVDEKKYDKKICPFCSAIIPLWTRICPKCGQKLE